MQNRKPQTQREINKGFERMLDHTHVLVAYLDPDFNFLKVNRAYAEADEREPAFFPGKNHFDLYPNEENLAIFQNVVQTGEAHFTEAKPFEYAEHPERGVSYWDWSLIPIKDDGGKVTGLVLTLENVTEKKKAELALRASEQRFRMFFENYPVYSGMISPQAKILDLNPAVLAGLGYERNELIGKPLTILYAPETREKMQLIFERWRQTGVLRNEEVTLITKTGERREAMLSADAVRNEAGEIIHSVSVLWDITDRIAAEKAQRESEARFRRIFDHSRDGIILVDAIEGKLLDANRAACQILGYAKDELIDVGMKSVLIEDFGEHLRREAAIRDKIDGWMMEARFRTKAGVILPVEISGSELEIGGRLCRVAIFRDLTERRQAEERLRNKAALVDSLARVARRLNAQLSLQGVLDAVCEETANGLRGAPVVAFFYDQATGGLKPATGSGVPAKLLDVSWPIAESKLARNWEMEPGVLYITGFPDDEGLLPASFASRFDIRTAVFAPIRRENSMVGLLCVLALGHTRAFGEYELAMIEGLADQAAQAVEAVRLRDQERQMAVHEVRSQLAMDLHDSVAQALYGVTLSAQAAERMVGSGDLESVDDQLRRIHEASRHALREMRLLIHELRPVELAEAGLEGALQARLESVEKRSGIEVVLSVDLERPLESELEQGLHRVAQEALNNVVKHSQAQCVK
ncbi:MAG: PAS domain S-box protein, partial [Anaerolineales bacterium]